MPAVTTDNILTLARIETPITAVPRPVLAVTTAPRGFEGEGFPVRRAFAGINASYLDPFIHMDQMGEVDYAPGEPKGTPWHPHRGFETVTYMIDGIFEHQDSNGGGGIISNGDTQWMTAGAGILHIEKPPEHLVMSGGLFNGVQLWVNLPSKDKLIAPRYQDIRGNAVRLLTNDDGGALIRVIAGDIGGHPGPGSTHTPIGLAHVTLAPGAKLELPWDPSFNALIYVLDGSGTVGPDKRPISSGQTAVFGSGKNGNVLTAAASAKQDSRSKALELFILGGRPIREPIAMAGPFVMNTREEVLQAFEDYQSGRFGLIPAERTSRNAGEN